MAKNKQQILLQRLQVTIGLKLWCYVCRQFLQYKNNSEYWTQKRTQSRNIHSIILNVHAVKYSTLKLSFQSSLHKLNKQRLACAAPKRWSKYTT